MAVPRDDSSVHKRRNTSPESQPQISPNGYYKQSPRLNTHKKPHTTITSTVDNIPTLPKPIPSSVPSTGKGMSLGGARPLGGVGSGIQAKPSSLGGAMAFPSQEPIPAMAITSLGPKRTPIKAAPKKPAPPKEDDIFASMGLSATPTFSHAPAPASRPATSASALGGSRWAASSITPAPASSTFAATSTFSATAASAVVDDDDGDDDNWDDDADLDDLLGD